jgi:F420-dependent oxidoreductase-like protein
MPLGLGLKLAQHWSSARELRSVFVTADEGGFDHAWCIDHFAAADIRGGGDPTGDILEAWTFIAAMAEATSRVRIGCMVTGNTYRHPGVLAKMAVTVDHLSDGRLEFGLGASWAEIEHTMLGIDYGTAGWRIERLDEACQLIELLWTQERTTFEGRHYTLRDAISNPKPVQKPRPPIWLGGAGEKKLLRVVALRADVWNLFWTTAGEDPDEASRLSGVLDGHCEAVGRDPADVRRSIQFPFRGVDATLALAEDFVARGFTELVVLLGSGRAEADAEVAASELLPRLRQLG